MCRSSYVHNLTFVLCKLQRCGRGTSKGKQGVHLPVVFLGTPCIVRKKLCHCMNHWRLTELSWVLCVPSEVAVQDEVFKLTAWLWLIITFLSNIIYLFPFTVAQALLSTSVCECKYVTQLLCTQANSKLYVPSASVFFILFSNASSVVVRTGHLMFQLAVSVVFILIWGGRGRVFVCINTWLRFIFWIGGLKGRDDDRIPHCECMVAQALRGRTKHDNYLSSPWKREDIFHLPSRTRF